MTSGLDSMIMVLDIEKKINMLVTQAIPEQTKMISQYGIIKF